MAQVFVMGRVTADLEPKTSAKQNPYVRFDMAEHISGARTQFFQVCAWSGDAQRLVKAKVKKGSFIWVSGSLEMEEFMKRDGFTKDKRLKILLDNWGFVPVGNAKGPDGPQQNESPKQFAPESAQEINGDKEALPE